MGEFVKVAVLGQLKEGRPLRVAAGGASVALFLVGGKVFATQDECPHHKASLSDGALEGKMISCPLHARTFDVESGAGMSDTGFCLKTFPVKIEGQDGFVEASKKRLF